MPATGRGKVKNPNDKRLKKNRPPSKASMAPKSRTQQLIDGDITVEDLDLEELRKGKCKDKNGGFSGRVPNLMPTALVTAAQVELRKRMQEEVNDTVEDAIKALHRIVRNDRAPAVAQVAAANSLIDRGLGKVPDKVMQEIKVHQFEEDMADILVDVEVDEDNNVVEFKKPKAKKSG